MFSIRVVIVFCFCTLTSYTAAQLFVNSFYIYVLCSIYIIAQQRDVIIQLGISPLGSLVVRFHACVLYLTPWLGEPKMCKPVNNNDRRFKKTYGSRYECDTRHIDSSECEVLSEDKSTAETQYSRPPTTTCTFTSDGQTR